MSNVILGIDIGGSGVKGAPVDLEKGDFATDRVRIPTPAVSTPENVAAVVAQIVDAFAAQIGPDSPVGITVPAPSLGGVLPFMANLDPSWRGCNAQELFAERLGRPVVVMNDADAAGVAEMQYGAGKGSSGLTIMTTLGTGIGTALFQDGVLIPNTEIGHMILPNGKEAEKYAAASVKDAKDLSYKKWAERLQVFYAYLEHLFYPGLIVVGGGVSRDHEKFLPLLDLRAPIVPAQLRNRAGIIGAACEAVRQGA